MSKAAIANLAGRLDALLQPWDRDDAPGLVIGVALDGAPVERHGGEVGGPWLSSWRSRKLWLKRCA